MYRLFRPLLFRLDPETAHRLTLHALRIAGNFPPSHWFLTQLYRSPGTPVQAFGLTFKNPVGLAAGYDKDALAINGLSALGFGHLEVGTVTLKPQPGNPLPRVFRLLEDQAVINRMGFPGKGADFVSMSLRKQRFSTQSHPPLAQGMPTLTGTHGQERRPSRKDVILGLNLGKNKDTPLEEAANDYRELMRRLRPFADYLTINISSPNTVGLRRLQSRELLENLLGQINLERGTRLTPALRTGASVKLPILVKIAPDLTDEELEDAVGVILDKGMDGIIATNTTLAREGLRSGQQRETGGLSGSPLALKSEAVLSRVVKLVQGRVPIISAGGIMSPADAKKRLALGASLVQVYTGLVYRGPKLVKEIITSL